LTENFSDSEIKMMFQALLQKRLSLSSQEILFIDEILLSESDLLYFRTIANRLLENEPFQYLLGETFFCDLILQCDQRALIPRPETEELVYWIKSIYKNQANLKVLDLCTGSGCIALGIKQLLPQAKVVGIDVSKEAIELANENAKKTNLEVHFENRDLLKDWELPELNQYDCWVSNPPYIPEDEMQLMHANVLKFEPHLALFVPAQSPLLFYEKIATQAAEKMKSGAGLFFEIHEKYAANVSELLLSLGFKNIEIKKDLQGKERMIKATKLG